MVCMVRYKCSFKKKLHFPVILTRKNWSCIFKAFLDKFFFHWQYGNIMIKNISNNQVKSDLPPNFCYLSLMWHKRYLLALFSTIVQKRKIQGCFSRGNSMVNFQLRKIFRYNVIILKLMCVMRIREIYYTSIKQ